MDMIQIGAFALAAALCAVLLKQRTPEIGMVLALLACVLLLIQTVPALEQLRDSLQELIQAAGLSEELLVPVLKTVGIAIVTKLSAELCRDAKENGIASFVELAGASAAALTALPLLNLVLTMLGDLY